MVQIGLGTSRGYWSKGFVDASKDFGEHKQFQNIL